MARLIRKVKYRVKYRPTTSDTQRYYLRALRETTKIIPSNFNYFIMYGTLLGFHREGNIIAWDYDVDIYVDIEHEEDIARIMKENNINIWRRGKGVMLSVNIELTEEECRTFDDPLDLSPRKPSVDFYFYKHYDDLGTTAIKEIGSEYSDTIRARHNAGCPPIPKKLVFPIKNKVMQGVKVKVPNKPAEILRLVYGDTYMTPNKKDVGASAYIKARRRGWKVTW